MLCGRINILGMAKLVIRRLPTCAGWVAIQEGLLRSGMVKDKYAWFKVCRILTVTAPHPHCPPCIQSRRNYNVLDELSSCRVLTGETCLSPAYAHAHDRDLISQGQLAQTKGQDKEAPPCSHVLSKCPCVLRHYASSSSHDCELSSCQVLHIQCEHAT